MSSTVHTHSIPNLLLALLLSSGGCGTSVEPGGGGFPDAGPASDTGTARPDAARPDAGPPVPGSVSALRLTDGAGRLWRVTGEVDEAPAALASIRGHNAFWFAWSVFNPGSSVFGAERDVREATIEGGAGCTVPCDQIAPACSGRDCIPSLESPTMVGTDSPNIGYLRDEDEVVGYLTAEGPRAYPHNILYWHEIVNDTVGGESFAVTFCPLTGSGLAFDRAGFVDGEVVELGVSGNLYNSNLTMYDRTSESFWSQMRIESVFGSEVGTAAPHLPVYEMTWATWRELFPDTLVVSGETGFSRDYQAYPYGSYRTEHANTFRRTDPEPDPLFLNKDMTFGLFAGGEERAYPWSVLEESVGSRRGVVNDVLGGVPVAVVFDLDARYVHAFDRRVEGETVEITLVASAP